MKNLITLTTLKNKMKSICMFVWGISAILIVCMQFEMFKIVKARYEHLEDAVLNEFRSAAQTLKIEAMAEYEKELSAKKSERDRMSDEAMNLAQKEIKNGDVVKARMYLLNALNRSPSNGKYMVEYYRFCKEQDIADVKSMEQLKNIIETSVYQVDPQYIEEMLKLYADVTHDIDNAASKAMASSIKESESKIKQSLNALTSGEFAWDKIIQDKKPLQLKLLQQRVETCEELVSADDNGSHELELELTMRSASILRIMDVIEQTLSKAELLLNGDACKFDDAAAQLQSARNHLATLWGFDFYGLSNLISNRVDTITDKIKTLEACYNTQKSKTPYEKIDKNMERVKEINDKVLLLRTTRMNMISKEMIAAQKTLHEVFDSDLRKKCEEKLSQCNKIVENLVKDRMVAYNKWAVDQCKDAVDEWNKIKVHSDGDAITIAHKYLLDIDPRNLIPATADFYNDILNGKILMGELGGKNRAELHVKLALAPKKSLEDF